MGSFLKQGAGPQETARGPSLRLSEHPLLCNIFPLFSKSSLPSPLQENTPNMTPSWPLPNREPRLVPQLVMCNRFPVFPVTPAFQAASVLIPEIKGLEIPRICGVEVCGRAPWNEEKRKKKAVPLSLSSKKKLTGSLEGTCRNV